MAEEIRWTPAVGARLRQARGAMAVREAARRAGFGESTWRAIELGVRRPAGGLEVPVNPRVETLIAAAEAVGVPTEEILALAGVEGYLPKPADPADPAGVSLLALAQEVREMRALLEEMAERDRRRAAGGTP